MACRGVVCGLLKAKSTLGRATSKMFPVYLCVISSGNGPESLFTLQLGISGILMLLSALFFWKSAFEGVWLVAACFAAIRGVLVVVAAYLAVCKGLCFTQAN